MRSRTGSPGGLAAPIQLLLIQLVAVTRRRHLAVAVLVGERHGAVDEVAERVKQFPVVAGDKVVDVERGAGVFRGDGREVIT